MSATDWIEATSKKSRQQAKKIVIEQRRAQETEQRRLSSPWTKLLVMQQARQACQLARVQPTQPAPLGLLDSLPDEMLDKVLYFLAPVDCLSLLRLHVDFDKRLRRLQLKRPDIVACDDCGRCIAVVTVEMRISSDTHVCGRCANNYNKCFGCDKYVDYHCCLSCELSSGYMDDTMTFNVTVKLDMC